jgi:hypothetical protein
MNVSTIELSNERRTAQNKAKRVPPVGTHRKGELLAATKVGESLLFADSFSLRLLDKLNAGAKSYRSVNGKFLTQN